MLQLNFLIFSLEKNKRADRSPHPVLSLTRQLTS